MKAMHVSNNNSLSTAQPGRWSRGTIWTAALRRLRIMRGAEGGVAAVEFGLFAPMLFVSLLAMIDIGFALSERMTIDHVLRAGAQTAMNGGNEAAVLDVLKTTADKSFTGDDALTLTVERYCACAESPDVAVACSTTCSGPAATSIFFRLTGAKSYDGIFMPTMSLAPSVEVQLR